MTARRECRLLTRLAFGAMQSVSFKHHSRTLSLNDYRMRDDALQSIKSITARYSLKEEYLAARKTSETDKKRDTIALGTSTS